MQKSDSGSMRIKFIQSSFTAKYNIYKLIYYEEHQYIYNAILRETQIKNWNRKKKLALIRIINPKFEDLLHTISEA